jgi:hypothetical protein
MFTSAQFAHLRFLEGRWVGKGPDGSDFYEEYTFQSDSKLTSTRYTNATFLTSNDGSVVALHNGEVMSVWKEFTWKASEIGTGKACFSPVNAPSSFCWECVSDTEVHVTQRWTDERGLPQQYAIVLRRL